MSMEHFEDFCARLCRHMGVAPPALAPGPRGIVAFTVAHGGASVCFALGQHSDPGVVIVVELGTVPPDCELAVLRALMDANLMMLDVKCASFGRNALTGVVSMHRPLSLPVGDIEAVVRHITGAADAVAAWQNNCFRAWTDDAADLSAGDFMGRRA